MCSFFMDEIVYNYQSKCEERKNANNTSSINPNMFTTVFFDISIMYISTNSTSKTIALIIHNSNIEKIDSLCSSTFMPSQ